MIVPFDAYYDEKNHLDRVYHKGQQKIWDGISVLEELFEEYPNDALNLSDRQATALVNILGIILWGEYVAWSAASDMSSRFDNFGAKMAAVSQAHDEARHFYVMRNYLIKRLNFKPKSIFQPALRVLEEVDNTNSLARKLLGLQLMVEPVAITIFRFLRKSEVDPILTKILPLFEQDESRHIALGVKFLPTLIKRMSFFEKVFFVAWQIKLILYEIKGLKCIEEDLEILNISPKEVFEFAENRQIMCLKELSSEFGVGERLWKPVIKIIEFKKRLAFYPNRNHTIVRRVINCFFDSL
jgi:hypothetical protein